ncbi:MAG: hypothetical protein AAB767_05160, partial [Patescibacteria group bacterium]
VYFPRGFKKEFKDIKFDYRSFYERKFFSFFKETRYDNLFQYFNKKSVNFCAKRVATGFGKAAKIFMPKFVCVS